MNILLQAAPSGGGYQPLIMIGLMVVVFYFFMLRPQQKKQKELRNFRENLKKGDRVVTRGGIHGKIETVKDNVVILSVEDGTKLRVEKAAIEAQYTGQ